MAALAAELVAVWPVVPFGRRPGGGFGPIGRDLAFGKIEDDLRCLTDSSNLFRFSSVSSRTGSISLWAVSDIKSEVLAR